MPLCTLTKFWHSQLMLIVHISAHKSWYFFVSVFSPEQKRKLPRCHGLYSAQQHCGGLLFFITGLQFPFNHDVRVSLHGTCFIIGRSRLQNQITLRLVFFSWQLLASLFIVHEYWRNSTSYIASCHPLYLLYTHSETGSSGSCIRFHTASNQSV